MMFDKIVSRPQIMGVINLTPNSFFAGSRAQVLTEAQHKAMQMCEEGADIIDVGGESTRPGATPVSVQEELERLIPFLKWLAQEQIPFSVDTRKAAVMQAVMEYHPKLINDVYALRDPGALEVVKNSSVQVCLMHMQGLPETMQQEPRYTDVVNEIKQFLAIQIERCEAVGITRDRIWIDPGFGFGKSLQHNLALLKDLSVFKSLGCRLLVGMSRKSMIGELLNKPAEQRLFGSLAAHSLAFLQGADMIRTHDVGPTKQTLTVLEAIKRIV